MTTWKKVGLVLPLVIFILSLHWVLVYMDKYDKDYYNTIFDEQISRVNHVVEAVDALKRIGMTYQKESDVFDSLVSEEMERMNQTPGISTCIITLDFDYIVPEETSLNLVNIFKIGGEDRDRLISEMQKSATGEIWVKSDGQYMKLYWREMPTINPGYYVIVGVDNSQIVRNVNILPLKIFTFVISIVTLVSIYDSLFLRMKSNRAEK